MRGELNYYFLITSKYIVNQVTGSMRKTPM